MSRPTLLIPVVFPEPELYPLTDTNIGGLDGFEIVLFGYWEVPDGTAPEAAREAHGTEAEAALYEMAAQFSHAGAPTDIQLHFGPAGTEKDELQDRIADETDADGVLIPNHITLFNDVLVPLRDDRNRDGIVDFVSAFDEEAMFVLELYHVAPDEAAAEAARGMLGEAKETLLDRGFSDVDIETAVDVTGDVYCRTETLIHSNGPVPGFEVSTLPSDSIGSAIADRARDHNIVVIGETEELDAEDRFLGPIYTYIADGTDTPVAVIRSR